MLAVEGEIYGVYTFSPKNPSADQLEELVKRLKKAPQKVLNLKRKKLSAFIDGSIRAMGLTYSYHYGFNTHLHVIFHCTHMLTEPEAQNLYDLLNNRFNKYMGIDHAETHMGLYTNSSENIKRTASYITKYADHQNLSKNILNMEVETYEAYQESYSHIREIEFAGCYRKKTPSHRQYTLAKIKKLFKEIHCEGKPEKLYEFTSVKEINFNS
jgi:hypothetical protein